MNRYPADTNAEAVVLSNVRKIDFQYSDKDNDIVIISQTTTRIKILTDAGLEYAKVSIPYITSENVNENVYNVRGATYNLENGEIVTTKLNSKEVYTEQDGPNSYEAKFALPNVKKGSVIEYRYKKNSYYKFFLDPWYFQQQIPVVYSELIVKVPALYEYSWLLQGARKFGYYDGHVERTEHFYGSYKFKDVVYDMAMYDVPAFRKEKYITSVGDYIMKIDFQLSKINYPTGGTEEVISTWDKLINKFLTRGLYGKYIKQSKRLSDKLIDTKALAKEPEAVRFDKIMDFVKSNYTWNQYNSKFTSEDPSELIKKGTGNSTDLNLFAIALLEKAGIEAYPVLISTRKHGKIKYNYPYVQFFNYMIILARVNGNYILTDATNPYLLNNRLPERCINDKGLILKEGSKVQWVNLVGEIPSESMYSNTISYANRKLHVDVNLMETEYFAADDRDEYKGQKDLLIKDLDSKKYSLIDSSVVILNQKNKKLPYVQKYAYNIDTDVVMGKIYISPFFDQVISVNPFKLDNRTYPIDMIFPRKEGFKTIINIPKGYTVDYLPENMS
ncbi:MAG: DUF3857 and transglutaminase domain-containing protein, partial [Bacteroidales bacterium]|nr:DUF3857 and transglutaminase domain-containing protein [Bacteroidales bacterium]